MTVPMISTYVDVMLTFYESEAVREPIPTS